MVSDLRDSQIGGVFFGCLAYKAALLEICQRRGAVDGTSWAFKVIPW